jgi:tight adherence protein C
MPTCDVLAHVPLAATGDALIWGPCLATGLAVAVTAYWLMATLRAEDLQQDDEWRYDVTRINALRKSDPIYRLFQIAIQFFAKLNRVLVPSRLPEIRRQIQAAGFSRYWLAEEYLGRAQLIAVLLFPLFLYVSVRYAGPAGAVPALIWSAVTVWLLRRRLAQTAQRRLLLIKRRMPYFLDLLTLLMEAGASFLDALKQGVQEFEGHAVATEFGRVLTDMNMGRTRREAFDNLRERLNDDEISSIVGSIIQSEALGTPLSEVFRTQADVLRLKRSQRAETIAAEAGVRMLLPGVLIMAAAVLLILGPFMLNYLHFGF